MMTPLSTNVKKKCAQSIKDYMTETRMSVNRAAKLAGVNVIKITDILDGKYMSMSLETIMDIMASIGVTHKLTASEVGFTLIVQ